MKEVVNFEVLITVKISCYNGPFPFIWIESRKGLNSSRKSDRAMHEEFWHRWNNSLQRITGANKTQHKPA